MKATDPSSLRAAFHNADSFHSRIMAFGRLMTSPDLRWTDLLEGLKHPGLITEQAAIDLHVRLKVPTKDGRLMKDIDFWEHYLRDAGIDKMAKVKE